MTIKSGFFNSVDNDRLYDAEDMNEFFDGLINAGVFMNIGDGLAVSPTTGLQVSVGSGKAWFLKAWLSNTADTFLVLDTADLTYDRIDVIAMDFDKTNSVRNADLIVVKGTPSGSPQVPAMVDTVDHLQVPLARISVDANQTTIIQADITDRRGTADCPWVTAVNESITTEDMILQWRSQFDQWITQVEQDLDAIDTGTVFDELQEIRETRFNRRNFIINGDFQIRQRTYGSWTPDASWYAGTEQGYSNHIDRWRMWGTAGLTNLRWYLDASGEQTPYSHSLGPSGQPTHFAYVMQAQASIPASDLCVFAQEIESSRLVTLLKGSTDARDMTLSFLWKSNVPGTFIVEVLDRQNGWSISVPFTSVGDESWESHELLIPKESTQALNTSYAAGLGVAFCLAAGSNYTGGGSLQSSWGATTTNKRFYGQTNLLVGASNYFQLTDIQLELGSQATPFERIPHYEELKLVQRYSEYQDTYTFLGRASTTSLIGPVAATNYAESKRANPTLEIDESSLSFVAGGSNWPVTNPSVAGPEDCLWYPRFNVTEAGANMSVGTLYNVFLNEAHWNSELVEDWD